MNTHSLITDKRLSPSCFRVLCFLAINVDDNCKVTMSEGAIASGCGIAKNTASSALDEAVALNLITRTFTSGSPATYLLRFALAAPKIGAHQKLVRPQDDEDDGGDWTAGEGDSRKLAELMLSRCSASDSDAFKHATARLIRWVRFGDVDPADATRAVPAANQKSVMIRVAIIEHFVGLRSEKSVVDFAAENEIHRSNVYRHLESFKRMFSVDLRSTENGKGQA